MHRRTTLLVLLVAVLAAAIVAVPLLVISDGGRGKCPLPPGLQWQRTSSSNLFIASMDGALPARVMTS
jgi:hypothetical protein